MQAEALASTKPARKWPQRLLLVVGVLLLAIIATSILAFLAWVDWESMKEEQAAAEFAVARAAFGAAEPYVSMSEDARFTLRREQERAAPAEIGRIRALIWEPKRERLLRLDVPFWFLSLKSGATIGLDAVVNDLASQIADRTQVSMDDLRKRGPGLYFDWANAHARLLMWGEPK
jgi:hypothetical protein